MAPVIRTLMVLLQACQNTHVSVFKATTPSSKKWQGEEFSTKGLNADFKLDLQRLLSSELATGANVGSSVGGGNS